ncbi:MAG: hypothetical protein LBJ09_03845 [Clostridiales bacterium]|jgi:hypothetical protein|nr:hypothetical protein [Clostridiales bacterium]
MAGTGEIFNKYYFSLQYLCFKEILKPIGDSVDVSLSFYLSERRDGILFEDLTEDFLEGLFFDLFINQETFMMDYTYYNRGTLMVRVVKLTVDMEIIDILLSRFDFCESFIERETRGNFDPMNFLKEMGVVSIKYKSREHFFFEDFTEEFKYTFSKYDFFKRYLVEKEGPKSFELVFEEKYLNDFVEEGRFKPPEYLNDFHVKIFRSYYKTDSVYFKMNVYSKIIVNLLLEKTYFQITNSSLYQVTQRSNSLYVKLLEPKIILKLISEVLKAQRMRIKDPFKSTLWGGGECTPYKIIAQEHLFDAILENEYNEKSEDPFESTLEEWDPYKIRISELLFEVTLEKDLHKKNEGIAILFQLMLEARDIQRHQGIPKSFQSMLDEFDPQRIKIPESLFEAKLKESVDLFRFKSFEYYESASQGEIGRHETKEQCLEKIEENVALSLKEIRIRCEFELRKAFGPDLSLTLKFIKTFALSHLPESIFESKLKNVLFILSETEAELTLSALFVHEFLQSITKRIFDDENFVKGLEFLDTPQELRLLETVGTDISSEPVEPLAELLTKLTIIPDQRERCIDVKREKKILESPSHMRHYGKKDDFFYFFRREIAISELMGDLLNMYYKSKIVEQLNILTFTKIDSPEEIYDNANNRKIETHVVGDEDNIFDEEEREIEIEVSRLEPYRPSEEYDAEYRTRAQKDLLLMFQHGLGHAQGRRTSFENFLCSNPPTKYIRL